MIKASDNTLPQSVESEYALTSLLLANGSRIRDVHEFVRPGDFFIELLGEFFRRSLDRFIAGQGPLDPVEFITVCGSEAKGLMRELGRHRSASPSSITHHARAVRDSSILRRQVIISERALSDIKTGAKSAASIGTAVINDLEDSLPDSERSHMLDETQLMDRWREKFETTNDERTLASTGVQRLDEHHGGELRAGELIILAAQTALGKTQFGLQVARHTAVHHGKRTLVLSLEMEPEELVDRWLAIESSVQYGGDGEVTQFRDGRLITPSRISKGHKAFEKSPELLKRVVEAEGRISSWGLNVYSPPGVDANTLRAVARSWKSRHADAGLIIVDYLQLLDPTDPRSSRNDQVASLSRAMKSMARDVGVPVLALSQLNRQADKQKDKPPEIEHLRDSGGIGQDANKVWFIWRPNYERDGEIKSTEEAFIAARKNRGGPEGMVKVMYRPGIGFTSPRFEEHQRSESAPDVDRFDVFDQFNDEEF